MEDLQTLIARLPHTPGVYLYRSQTGRVLYVGKAKDLKKRVSQYWVRDAIGPKTQLLVSQIADIETIHTASEFDALLLEAKLIHDLAPKYNVALKDDKSPLYVLITLSEELPHVRTVRRTDIPKKLKRNDALFGPFPSATVVRAMLHHLRHTIPYCTQKRRTGNPCFYTHLGLCTPCPSVIVGLKEGETKTALVHEYRTNIFRLKQILSGKSGRVTSDLTKQMQTLAAHQQFEEAEKIRNHIQHLSRLLQKSYDPMVYVESDTAIEDIRKTELDGLLVILAPYIPELTRATRIECVDISNIAGTFATGSLVVLTNGNKDTSQYKRFRIRRNPPAGRPNDVAMMAEVITRRLSHQEWPFPDLLVIDGGKPQVSAAMKAMQQLNHTLPIVGLAKRFEEVIVPLPHGRWKTLRLGATNPGLHVLERIRDEAHRFALSYHKLLRSRGFDTIEPT